ncbi:hypothetical protein AA23498_1193 [Acetobacter nitrogenifigens DSM 23921 = NBRC 105050]|uniref:Terminase n=1 Tax=Acetobacter nitrogenifigens DSM 23921 = NBRC 105050 TaxID=1120919 RepID=A0A511XD21_9PROT|nr:hypothetical protein [Acetobacter nitrogenifigens]GBQ91484.1 hypothetical protein AA23498_1193 [Acetobacter nitrogenifigens DSM 23921 = NBRC 105050]GEN60857.1 hypothetical protein ANI02nite_27410 [Acetobacter nitrogenifigens DSM 23921 = NBRC 105050]
MSEISILDAMHDPALFGEEFTDASWDAWKAFLAALLALPATETQAELIRACTGRLDLPVSPFRRAALICGRRAGKSRMLALLGTCLATLRDYRSHLSAGEVATVGIIAADRRQARTIFRYVRGLINSVPAIEAEVTSETNETIELGKRRVVIEIGTASFRGTRGYTYAAVLCDEVAFWRDDTGANPDEEIITALRPGLATIPGSMLLLASSPYARRGVLWKTFRKHYGQEAATTLVWKASTRTMNPSFDEQEEREAYEEDPEKASAEYGAEFRSDIASFVTPEVVSACTAPGRFELPFIRGVRYRAFCDPSGGSSDSFTLAIAHEQGDITVLDCVREIKAPFSPDAATREMADTIKSYGLKSVTGDRYGGEWPRERFRVHGVNYHLSEKDRSGLYLEMLPKMNAGKVELLDLKQIERQFCGLERRTARSGRDSVDHAPGGHDDVANAIAGVIVSASTRKPMRFTAADIARI